MLLPCKAVSSLILTEEETEIETKEVGTEGMKEVGTEMEKEASEAGVTEGKGHVGHDFLVANTV